MMSLSHLFISLLHAYAIVSYSYISVMCVVYLSAMCVIRSDLFFISEEQRQWMVAQTLTTHIKSL